MSRMQRVWRLMPLLVGVTFLLAGCRGQENLSTLQPKGFVAETQLSLITLSFSLMMLVIGVVSVIFIYVVIRFRAKPGDTEIPKQVEGNHLLEIVWTVLPILLLLVLAVPTVNTTFTLAKDYSDDPDAIQVNVTAHLYWWEFEYPELGITTAQDLYIPVGKKVHLNLFSDDVIHSFWVPALAGKMDTNPDNLNQMYIDAYEPGIYKGKCAELCGPAHALMDFKVIAVEEADFDAWVAGITSPPEVPNTALVQHGQEVFQSSCIGCHAIDAGTSTPIAPNLAGFGDRLYVGGFLENTEENIARWLKETDELKPYNYMGNIVERDGLDDSDVDALVAYLKSLKFK